MPLRLIGPVALRVFLAVGVARVKLAMVMPPAVERISGSLPTLPRRRTLLTPFAMVMLQLLLVLKVEDSRSKMRFSTVYVRLRSPMTFATARMQGQEAGGKAAHGQHQGEPARIGVGALMADAAEERDGQQGGDDSC